MSSSTSVNGTSAPLRAQESSSDEPASARLSDPYVDTDEEMDEDDPEYVPMDADWEDEDDEPDEENEDEDVFYDLNPADGEELQLLTDIIQEEYESGGVVDGDEDEDEDEEDDDDDESQIQGEAITREGNATTLYLSRDQLMRLLGSVGFRTRSGRYLSSTVQQEADPIPSRRSRRRVQHPLEPVPNKNGEALLENGTFGFNERRIGRINRTRIHARRILERELGSVSYGREKAQTPLLKQDMIPNDQADMVINYGSRCYSGQFSYDGNFFFACSQDFKVRMYDTSNPYDWKYYKTADMPYGNWTITDAHLTNDNRHLVFSSMSHVICLTSTDPSVETHSHPLDLGRGSGPARSFSSHRWFSVYSVRFSGDGREVVAGTGDNSIYVFDIERDQTVLRISNHDDDVNAVCFGDVNSPHILYSGSDDCTVKVWDRRSMGDGRAAGVFLGHTEGVTYVDSKGDGRYVISNGKDQTAKLWDLRKVIATEKAEKVDTLQCYSQSYNYRDSGYDVSRWEPHPDDCSLVTFRGHKVESTLIRCHFSPQGSTDSRYVYSGSQDGKVYIWNLDATLKDTIDVGAATSYLKDRSQIEFDSHWASTRTYNTVVRDCSWHPSVPMITATAWNGWGSARGTASVHSWNDDLEGDDAMQEKGLRVDAELQAEDLEEDQSPRARRQRRAAR